MDLSGGTSRNRLDYFNTWLVPFIGVLIAFISTLIDFQLTSFLLEFGYLLLCFAIFSVTYLSNRLSPNSFCSFLGVSFFWVAVLSTVQTLYSINSEFLYSLDAGQINYLAKIHRLMACLAVAIAPFLIRRRIRLGATFIMTGLFTALVLYLTFAFLIPLDRNYPLQPVSRFFELVIILITITALAIYHLKKIEIEHVNLEALRLAIYFILFSQIAFYFYEFNNPIYAYLYYGFRLISAWLIFYQIRVRSFDIPIMEEKIFSLAMEQSPSIIMITDTQGNIEYVNHAFEKNTGYQREEVTGKNPRLMASGKTPFEQYKKMWDTISEGMTWKGFFENRKKSGQEFTEATTISSLKDNHGTILKYIATKEDFSEKKRLEMLLSDDESSLQQTLIGAIEAIADLLEARDPYTYGHSSRVADMVMLFAEEAGLSPERKEALRLAAIIHDIGKIKIPMEILNKPGKLTEEEFALVKHHPEIGYKAIKNIPFPMDIPSIVLTHHEKWDGSGYPLGLKGDEISLEAQLLSLADVIESISSHRPYRPSLGIDKAFEIIQETENRHFSTQIVKVALAVRDKGLLV